MTGKSDAELLEAARGGDARALEQLLQRHEKRVYRFGLRMCGSEADAKDVLQETLLAALDGIHDFRGDSELSTWLYQVARTHCFRARRRRVGEPAVSESLDSPEAAAIPSEMSGPEAASHAREMGALLQSAILALPDDYRETLILRDVEGLSAREAAEVVGIEERALKSRLHRARVQLREHLVTLLADEAAAGGAPCPGLVEDLAAYAAQDVDQATCVRIEDHLESCPRCTANCDALKRAVSLCRKIPGDDVPGPVRSAVRRALTAAAARASR